MASHNAAVPAAPVTPPRSSRHEITRSISEVTSPGRLSRVQQHSRQPSRHQHQNHHHLQLHRKNRGHDDGKAPQPAQPTVARHSLDIPRLDGPDRGRQHLAKSDELFKATSHAVDPDADKEEKLRREHEKAAARVEYVTWRRLPSSGLLTNFVIRGLRTSLVELHAFSTTATRQLDETYYAALEKMGALQDTVTALKSLAETSREIYTTFEKESGELETEVSGQLDNLGPFDEQQEKIESLQARIRDGRAKIQSLSGRVEVVRKCVEGWERADKAWQERTRRRLRVIWSIFFVVVLAIGVLFFLSAGEPKLSHSTIPDEEPSLELDVKPDSPLGRLLNESRRTLSLRENQDAKADEPAILTKPMEADERLRAFDEL